MGNVGATLAYTLVLNGLAADLVLICGGIRRGVPDGSGLGEGAVWAAEWP